MGIACLAVQKSSRTPRGGTRRRSRTRPAAQALVEKNQTHREQINNCAIKCIYAMAVKFMMHDKFK